MESLTSFLIKRLFIGILIAIVLLWGVNKLINQNHTTTTSFPEPELAVATSAPEAAPVSDTPALHTEEAMQESVQHAEEFIPESILHSEEGTPESIPHTEESTPGPIPHAEEFIPESIPHAEEFIPEPSQMVESTAPEPVPMMEEITPEAVTHTEKTHPEAELHAEEAKESVIETEAHTAEASIAAESVPSSESHATPQVSAHTETAQTHPSGESEEHGTLPETPLVKGVAFVNAVIEPLDYELNERFYGWRPNDIINVTDNVENFQRGVLEVTRRTVRILTERISRTGNTIAFNTNLENAMNWLMVKADTYWFPSPEAKYQEALDELELYKKALEDGKESFFARTDNIIPLLQVFEDLLGSCEENLVKKEEKDGSVVGFFASDDYFFYAKGVASAMHTILEAVEIDFGATIESRKGMEELMDAIESLHHAYEIDPLIVLNSDPDSLWANHRANMAAPISHAKFYVGVLITTLST